MTNNIKFVFDCNTHRNKNIVNYTQKPKPLLPALKDLDISQFFELIKKAVVFNVRRTEELCKHY